MTPAQFQLTSKKQLSISDSETIINCIYPGVAPTTYALLQKAQPISAAVEQSFSMLSKLLRRDRNFDIKNVKKYMFLYYNKSFWQLYCEMFIKNRKSSNIYKLCLVAFLRTTSWQNGSFFTLCCHAPLGCRFYKIGTSKRHIKPKYVRLNYGQNLLIIKSEIIF